MTSHLEETLQADLQRLTAKVTKSGQLVQQALQGALQAVAGRDRQAAYLVILRDRRIDELEKQTDRMCLEFLVRQQPVAQHLRLAYATIKINAELERIGDYAESIARQGLKLLPFDISFCAERIRQIAGKSIPMLGAAVEAFVKMDADLARTTMRIEDEVDVLRSETDGQLLAAVQDRRLPVEALTPLLTVVRRFERASDQAKNICEEVLYMCTGEYSKHLESDVVRVMFVDRANACLSQMAEAIAKRLDRSEFVFNSAGVEPRPILPGAAAFLKEKGIDISHHSSKLIEQLPNLEHYNVVISLQKGLAKTLPPALTKAVGFDWNPTDPSLVQGSPEKVLVAYEDAFQYLTLHIRDLVEAILGEQASMIDGE